MRNPAGPQLTAASGAIQRENLQLLLDDDMQWNGAIRSRLGQDGRFLIALPTGGEHLDRSRYGPTRLFWGT